VVDVPEEEGLTEEPSDDRGPAKKGFFPSSMGLSTLVASDATALTVDRALG
jgi:hypothetical protein